MMEQFLHRFYTYILTLTGYISRTLSMEARTKFGILAGRLMKWLGKSRVNITIENLRQSFPGKSEDWYKKVMVKTFENLGITLVEVLALPTLSEEEIKKYISFDNIELLDDAYKKGKGVILLSGHYGNWEVLAYSVGVYLKIPVNVIVKPQKNSYADKLMNQYRERSGNKMINMYNAARTIVRILREGGAIALLADQSANEVKDIFVDFFGRPAATYEAPAELALKFNVPIIMGFAERQGDNTYRVNLFEVKHDDLAYNHEDVLELTRRHVKALEEAIRRNPEQWVWQHRRWKHQPPAEFIKH